MEEERIPIGRFVLERRKHLGMGRQLDLAKRSGVSQDRVSYLERCKGAPASLTARVLHQLAEALQVPDCTFLEWVLAGSVPSAAVASGALAEDGVTARILLGAVQGHPGILAALLETSAEGCEASEAIVVGLLEAQAAVGAPLTLEACQGMMRGCPRSCPE